MLAIERTIQSNVKGLMTNQCDRLVVGMMVHLALLCTVWNSYYESNYCAPSRTIDSASPFFLVCIELFQAINLANETGKSRWKWRNETQPPKTSFWKVFRFGSIKMKWMNTQIIKCSSNSRHQTNNSIENSAAAAKCDWDEQQTSKFSTLTIIKPSIMQWTLQLHQVSKWAAQFKQMVSLLAKAHAHQLTWSWTIEPIKHYFNGISTIASTHWWHWMSSMHMRKSTWKQNTTPNWTNWNETSTGGSKKSSGNVSAMLDSELTGQNDKTDKENYKNRLFGNFHKQDIEIDTTSLANRKFGIHFDSIKSTSTIKIRNKILF